MIIGVGCDGIYLQNRCFVTCDFCLKINSLSCFLSGFGIAVSVFS